ncbi:BTB/POZ domain-containing protein 6-B-like isoform X1 [Toxorhynchites rutilus septentrionalis]|uniref:BTB/POZ domain-containing protein 6-B-like isoform X1 n=1 Tax=Toxorhynchites rutilus septentrionalis TaxID=329112 RepID=UPI0024791500|nr:BTB/POZ domain-containing protein 6-B-like isoform X1 [Toxorhynchites rutilus septentrionalis]
MDLENIITMLSAVEQISYNLDTSIGLKYDTSFSQRQESLINNRFQSDVTFMVGEKRQPIHAHKLLLIIASEYFNAMFNGNFRESSSGEIEVSDVEPDIFLEILRFIYCGKVRLTIENALEIYVHAQKYMLNELRRRTIRFLENHIDSHNVLKIFTHNRLYEFSFINDRCLTLIRKNPLTYFRHEDFTSLDRKSLEIILASKKINCSDEQLFQALRDWKKNNESEYADEMVSVMNQIRTYNCSKLRFFGNMSMAEQTDLKFSIMCNHSLAFFGIGVFVKSTERFVTIEVEITENLESLGSYRFDYENKDPAAVNKANLFFEELTLHPDDWYSISVNFSYQGDSFTIINPQICHDKVKLDLESDFSAIKSVISHLYYDEIRK